MCARTCVLLATFSASVALLVGRAEISQSLAAKDSMDKAWNRLRLQAVRAGDHPRKRVSVRREPTVDGFDHQLGYMYWHIML